MTKEEFHEKWENYWYYYKVHTIVTVCVIIVIMVAVTQCSQHVNPDMKVIITSKTASLTEDDTDAIGNAFAKYTADVNGDGKKKVECDFLDLNPKEDVQEQEAMNTRLLAELSDGSTIIYITDDSMYNLLSKQGAFQDIKQITKSGKSEYRIPLSQIPALANIKGVKVNKGLTLSMRVYHGTNIDTPKNKPDYDNSVNILEKLIG